MLVSDIYNELLWLASFRYEPIVINEKSRVLLEKIFELIENVKKKGASSERYYWIWQKREAYEEYMSDKDDSEDRLSADEYYDTYGEIEWFRVNTVFLPPKGNNLSKYYYISINDHNVRIEDRDCDEYEQVDVSELLEWLMEKTELSVQLMRKGYYEQYITDNLPNKYKVGLISRKEFYNIYPEERDKLYDSDSLTKAEVEEFIRIAPDILSSSRESFSSMTVRQYFEICALGLKRVGKKIKRTYRFKETEEEQLKYDGLTPRELYVANADGRDNGLINVPLDDEAALKEWLLEEGPYYVFNGNHTWEIMPCLWLNLHHENIAGTDKWHFGLGGENYRYKELVIFALELHKAGVPFVLGQLEELLDMFEETDMIAVVPAYTMIHGYSVVIGDVSVRDYIYLSGHEKLEGRIAWLDFL